MMELLGTTSIRRGRDGMNTNSPYYANYDEAQANPFPQLPDALVLKNGKKVTTADTRTLRTGRDSWILRPGILNPLPRLEPGEFPPELTGLSATPVVIMGRIR